MSSKEQILITGGARRVGRALALGLATKSRRIFLHYFESHQEAETLAAQIEKMGSEVKLIEGDFRDSALIGQIQAKVRESGLGLSVLINNASTYPDPSLIEAKRTMLNESLKDWEAAIAVNARTPFFLIQALHEALASKKGCVINILDESYRAPFFSRPSHSVSKAALHMVTQIAAHALSPDVDVYGLELGPIIAGDKMNEEEKAKRQWLGTEPVLAKVQEIVRERPETGSVLCVR